MTQRHSFLSLVGLVATATLLLGAPAAPRVAHADAAPLTITGAPAHPGAPLTVASAAIPRPSALSNAQLPKARLPEARAPKVQLPKLTGTPLSFTSLPTQVQQSMRASLAAAMRADGVTLNTKRPTDDCGDTCGDPPPDCGDTCGGPPPDCADNCGDPPPPPDCGDTCGDPPPDCGDTCGAASQAAPRPGTPGPVAGCVGYKSASVVGDIYQINVYHVYFTATVDCSRAPSIFAVAAQAGGRFYDWAGHVGQVAPTWSAYQAGRTYTYTIGQICASYSRCSVDYVFGAATAWDGSATHTWVIK